MAPGRILVVDDERLFRELFRGALAARGYDVRTAASAEEALEALAAAKADLLLTDVRMPGMDGVELVAEALQRDPGMEAVAVTGADDLATAVRAMRAGCADFLVKPVDDEALGHAAARALSRARVRREHGRLLDENLEFARAQSLLRESLSILGTLEGERLHELILQVLGRVTDAQAAALWVADDHGQLVLRATRGPLDRAALPAAIDPRAAERTARLAAGEPYPAPGSAPGQAFELPLRAEGETVGLALLADRARGRFGGEEQVAADAVGRFAAIALRNARRLQALERIGLRDRDTGAYNLASFVDYAGKEFYKARRYGRCFSLAVLTLDEADRLRREAGREPFRAALRGLVAAVERAARDADLLARVTDHEYYLLLPETDHFGTRMLARRVAEEIGREPSLRELGGAGGPPLALGAATFPRDGEDFDELLHRARLRQEEQRRSAVRRLPRASLGPAAFGELCELLLDGRGPVPEVGVSALRGADPELFAAAQREAVRQIGRDPRARGLLYLAGGKGGAAAALEALPSLPPGGRSGDGAARIVVVGGEEAGRPTHPLLGWVPAAPGREVPGLEALLFLTEESAYALLQDGSGRAFHSSDAPLVDALVSRLQALHDLEPM